MKRSPMAVVIAVVLLAGLMAAPLSVRGAGVGGWTPLHTPDSGMPDRFLDGVSCVGPASCWVTGYDTFHTHDGGQTWQAQLDSVSYALYGISCPDAQTCVAVGDKGTIERTDDGGATWRPQGAGTASALLTVSCPTARVCYVGTTDGALLKTSDGGGTWQSQHNPQSGTGDAWGGVKCTSARACVAVGYYIAATTDGGATWVQRDDPDHVLNAVACPGAGACYAAGFKGEITKSADGGRTWTRLTTGAQGVLQGISCTGPRACVAVGDNGLILSTSDGGASWTHQASGTTVRLWNVACAGGVCYAVGRKGTVLARR